MSRRKKYDAGLKAKIALEAVKCEKTVNQLSGIYEIHPNQIGLWKRKLIEKAPNIFSTKCDREQQENLVNQEELYQKIGQMAVEIEYLKKKLKKFH